MQSITLSNGQSYDSLATIAEADTFLFAEPAYAAAWAALTDDAKGSALIASTRRFLRLDWAAGSIPDTEQQVIDASILYAAQIAGSPASSVQGATGSNIKALGAGSSRVEYFAPSAPTRFDAAVFELLSGYLRASGSISGGESFGGCEPDEDRRHDFRPDRGFA